MSLKLGRYSCQHVLSLAVLHAVTLRLSEQIKSDTKSIQMFENRCMRLGLQNVQYSGSESKLVGCPTVVYCSIIIQSDLVALLYLKETQIRIYLCMIPVIYVKRTTALTFFWCLLPRNSMFDVLRTTHNFLHHCNDCAAIAKYCCQSKYFWQGYWF